MNAVKCSVMTDQHERSLIFYIVELLNADTQDNRERAMDSVITNVFLCVYLCVHGKTTLLMLYIFLVYGY